MAEPKPDDKPGWHLPGWVRELALKILYVVVPLLIVAAVNLQIDNINLKKDVAREAWRNDKQDMRQDRQEMEQDRTNAELAAMKDTQNEFQYEAIKRLDVLLEKERRRR